MTKEAVAYLVFLWRATRPFSALQSQFGDSAPDRGSHGRFGAAMSTCEIPDAKILRGGHSSGHFDRDGQEMYTYSVHPAGTLRPEVEAFQEAFCLNQARASETREELESMLHGAVGGGITGKQRGEFTEALRIPAGRQAEFWESLVRLQAIQDRGGTAEISVPVVPVRVWKEYFETPRRDR